MESGRTVSVPETYLRAVERKVEDFRVIAEISSLISSTLDLQELMPLVMGKAKSIVDAEACSILFYNRETDKLEFEIAMCHDETASEVLRRTVSLEMGQGIAGWVAEKREPLVIDDVTTDSRFYADADKATGFRTESIIAVPLIGRSGLIGVAEILNPRKRDYDPELFQLLCRQFAIAIENARFHKESLEQERLKQEIEIAATIQKSFLPPSPAFERGKVHLHAVNIPASRVGGDLYDFVELPDGRVGIFIGDVSGKGISAALYMAKAISDFRYVAYQEEDPERALDRLNNLLLDAPLGMFVTGTYGIIDGPSATMRISVAGHPPFLLSRGGIVETVNGAGGPPLGIMPTAYVGTDFTLQEGDRLVLLTDGVFDAKNQGGARIGLNSVISFVKHHSSRQNLLDLIVEHIRTFVGDQKQADDMTLIDIRYGD